MCASLFATHAFGQTCFVAAAVRADVDQAGVIGRRAALAPCRRGDVAAAITKGVGQVQPRYIGTGIGVLMAQLRGGAVIGLLQHDVDHTGHGIGAIDGAGAVAEHFDALDL